MRKLNEMFPETKGYASRKNAEAKLEKYKGAIGDALTVTTQRDDGRWLAVVIKQPHDILPIPLLCLNGICVAN